MSDPMLRTMQVIIAAMTAGLVVAFGAVLFLRSQPRPAVNPPAGADMPAISYAAVALVDDRPGTMPR